MIWRFNYIKKMKCGILFIQKIKKELMNGLCKHTFKFIALNQGYNFGICCSSPTCIYRTMRFPDC